MPAVLEKSGIEQGQNKRSSLRSNRSNRANRGGRAERSSVLASSRSCDAALISKGRPPDPEAGARPDLLVRLLL
jgi:hypothetical protein